MASDPRAAVEAAIPHRDPFLFVDRVVERGERSIVTEWYVPRDLACFAGHFPADPVLPGVLVCEFAFQSAAILFSPAPGARSGDAEPGALPLLTRIEDARFKRVVRPGETLRAELALDESLGPARFVSAHVRRVETDAAGELSPAGSTVLRVRFAVALVAPVPESA